MGDINPRSDKRPEIYAAIAAVTTGAIVVRKMMGKELSHFSSFSRSVDSVG
jgi:hypothetical protein